MSNPLSNEQTQDREGVDVAMRSAEQAAMMVKGDFFMVMLIF